MLPIPCRREVVPAVSLAIRKARASFSRRGAILLSAALETNTLRFAIAVEGFEITIPFAIVILCISL